MSLRCEARILKEIHKRKDVTYRIEWFADGKSVKIDTKCDSPPEQATCQSVADAKVRSTLDGANYTIGQWVSLCCCCCIVHLLSFERKYKY